MVAKFKTVFLGVETKVSSKGNEYDVVSFMDGGKPCSAVVNKDASLRYPQVLTECNIAVSVDLGRYTKVEVLSIGE